MRPLSWVLRDYAFRCVEEIEESLAQAMKERAAIPEYKIDVYVDRGYEAVLAREAARLDQRIAELTALRGAFP